MWDFLWHSIWGWVGGAGLIVVACAAVGYFFPPLRRVAIEIAGVVLAATAIYAKGTRDESKKWDRAIERDVKKGQQARSDAQRDVDAGRVRGNEWYRRD